MTEALRAAIEALDETDHTRLPAHMVAEIVLSGAATALRRQIEEEMVAPDPGQSLRRRSMPSSAAESAKPGAPLS
jgi:hypothetical protein